ncbi:hypothetical protein C8F01DRAFT_1270830 [Mycena amicta]|nr:hypothetical protein C8F01DRAFT_1270830 [Mycena amicta]
MSSRTTLGSNGNGSLYSKTANLSVTIIPPSPVVNSSEQIPDLPTNKPTANIDGLPATTGAERPPVPTKPVPSAPVVPRPPTPKSKERTPKSSPQLETANLPGSTIRPQSSNKSLKSKAAGEQLVPPIPTSSSHIRAATSPPTIDPGHSLSESPTELRPTEFSSWKPPILHLRRVSQATRHRCVSPSPRQGQKKPHFSPLATQHAQKAHGPCGRYRCLWAGHGQSCIDCTAAEHSEPTGDEHERE